jgi:hypothetical protein
LKATAEAEKFFAILPKHAKPVVPDAEVVPLTARRAIPVTV